uniref:TPR_REGION domain-containing protein n=1 Tax=Onchocerca flexuosa TaxID=387005 RepID=A0A183HTL6_9BILA
LRSAAVSSSTSVDVVKLHSNRCTSLTASSSLIDDKSWKKKLEYAAACYQAGRIDVAEEMRRLLPQRTHVLATSLKIRFFVLQKRFWDALHEIEKVLNEDTASLDVSTKVSKSVMDEFYKTLSNCDNAVDEVHFFFCRNSSYH